MSLKFIAVKKENINYYSIFEVIPQGESQNHTVYKLIPQKSLDFRVRSNIQYDNYNDRADNYHIRRALRREPWYEDTHYVPTYSRYMFEITIRNRSYRVPIFDANALNTDRCLGKRWSDLNMDYLFSWNSDNNDVDNIKNYLVNHTYAGENIILQYPNTLIKCPITPIQGDEGQLAEAEVIEEGLPMQPMVHSQPMAPSQHSRPLPGHVIQGWLKNNISEHTSCPITYEELTAENICTTSCYHVMDYNAACQWIYTNDKCPMCRAPCTIGALIRLAST
jgi:hypothetical protein